MLSSVLDSTNKIYDKQIDSIVGIIKEKLIDYNSSPKVYATIFSSLNSNDDFSYLYKNQKFNHVFPNNNLPNNFHYSSNNTLILYDIIDNKEYSLLVLSINIPDSNIRKTIGRLVIEFNNNVLDKKLVEDLFDNNIINQLIVMTFNYIYNRISLVNSFVYNMENYINLLSSRESYMPYHSQNVADFAIMLYDSLDIEKSVIDRLNLYIAALLHDVGKLIISDKILTKSEILTSTDYDKIKSHPIAGYELMKNQVSSMELIKNVPLYIKHHHEWYDGMGYPDGLKKKEIPIFSRIIMVSDAVDAMLSEREYKSAFSVDQVITELKRYRGSQFDPIIANKAIDLLKNKSKFIDILKRIDTAFIGDVSLSIKNKRDGSIDVFQGNLFYKSNTSYLKLSKKDNNIDTKYNNRGIISFFVQNTLVQYDIEIEEVVKNSVKINKFIWKPTDKYFSIMWSVSGFIKVSKNNRKDISIIRVGGNSLSFMINTFNKKSNENLSKFKINDSISIGFTLEIDDIYESFLIDSFIIDVHKFSDKLIFSVEYKDVLPKHRDRLFKAMFRKQMSLQKIDKPKTKL